MGKMLNEKFSFEKYIPDIYGQLLKGDCTAKGMRAGPKDLPGAFCHQKR